ncbi:uncharacterized protein [Phyllobates terribilis]|uniref:uncharacterized protein n=1 Tax=Phyllobates terribilis TaxID=111132 RepID=UPI003CCABF34
MFPLKASHKKGFDKWPNLHPAWYIHNLPSIAKWLQLGQGQRREMMLGLQTFILAFCVIAKAKNINHSLKHSESAKMKSEKSSIDEISTKHIGNNKKPGYPFSWNKIIFPYEPTLIVIGASIPKNKNLIGAKLGQTSLELISMSHVIFDIVAQTNETIIQCTNSSSSNDISASTEVVNFSRSRQKNTVTPSKESDSTSNSSTTHRSCDPTTKNYLLIVNVTFISKVKSSTYFFKLGNENLFVDIYVSTFAFLKKSIAPGGVNTAKASFNIYAVNTQGSKTSFGSLGYGDNSNSSTTAIEIKPTITKHTTFSSTTTTASNTTGTNKTLSPGTNSHTPTTAITQIPSRISTSDQPVPISSSRSTQPISAPIKSMKTNQTTTIAPPKTTIITTKTSTNTTSSHPMTIKGKATTVSATVFFPSTEVTSTKTSAGPSTPPPSVTSGNVSRREETLTSFTTMSSTGISTKTTSVSTLTVPLTPVSTKFATNSTTMPSTVTSTQSTITTTEDYLTSSTSSNTTPKKISTTTVPTTSNLTPTSIQPMATTITTIPATPSSTEFITAGTTHRPSTQVLSGEPTLTNSIVVLSTSTSMVPTILDPTTTEIASTMLSTQLTVIDTAIPSTNAKSSSKTTYSSSTMSKISSKVVSSTSETTAPTSLNSTTAQSTSTRSPSIPTLPTISTFPTSIISTVIRNPKVITSTGTTVIPTTKSTQSIASIPPTLTSLERATSNITSVSSIVSSTQPTTTSTTLPSTTTSRPTSRIGTVVLLNTTKLTMTKKTNDDGVSSSPLATTRSFNNTISKSIILGVATLGTMGTSFLIFLCIMISRILRKAGTFRRSTTV